MKTLTIALALCAIAAGPLFAQHTNNSGAPSIRLPDITVNSEVVDLAKGYQRAFDAIERRPVNALVKVDDDTTLLSDITKVTAFGGAVRIELRTGLVYVISAKDVLVISDDTRLKP